MRRPYRHVCLIVFCLFLSCKREEICLVVSEYDSPRITFGTDKLATCLTGNKYQHKTIESFIIPKDSFSIIIGTLNDSSFLLLARQQNISFNQPAEKEGFEIKKTGQNIWIAGCDESGALYGCLELIDRINQYGKIPKKIQIRDKPDMIMRGACIGLQKTTYLPGRTVYEYPYTPENFPWFYDKEMWIKYLDMLVENRMNSLYLWNGHPFASLVKTDDYPYAVEVNDSIFKLNEEIFSFLTEEADKRGIWVIQMFYNIIVSKPFAEYHHIKTQEKERPILPVIADYTRKSIAAFIKKYPHVGLLVCLGEAMNTIEDDIEWFTCTIIPGVQDGIKALGKSEEPPIILRGHDTDAKRVMEASLPAYRNLYTMHKYNGESLTTFQPRSSWAEIHQGLSNLGSVHISNVHILANLEPFRYGSPDFIRKSVVAMHKIQGANGLHLYPQASYWDWPYTADKCNPRLLQIDRDWIWYKTWGRYAWNCYRDTLEENKYWAAQLGNYYGCGKYGNDILEAYNESGEIAPKVLRRFGISDGNRQTLLLGMFMGQLVNPYKYRVYQNFYESNGPEGEILLTWAEKEWNKKPHIGETPPQTIAEVVKHAQKALNSIEKATPHIKKNREEYLRLKNDIKCYYAFAMFFSEKVRAAMFVLNYKYSQDITDLEKAIPFLENSVKYYKEMVNLTKDSYLYANSMQTSQRRIPVAGTDGKNKTWEELFPMYEEELVNFVRNIKSLKTSEGNEKQVTWEIFQPIDIELSDKSLEKYALIPNQKIYTDKDYFIKEIAPELQQLKGIRYSFNKQQEEGTLIHFRCDQPVQVVVGYFNGHSFKILPPPTLETNAQANDRGQADIKLANAMEIPGLYPVNIYTYYYEAGEHELKLGKGIVLILGFMNGKQMINVRDASIGNEGNTGEIDWLFQ